MPRRGGAIGTYQMLHAFVLRRKHQFGIFPIFPIPLPLSPHPTRPLGSGTQGYWRRVRDRALGLGHRARAQNNKICFLFLNSIDK